ncbi:aflatoxin biosynthesis ketoreductase-like protein nor-1 [Mytilinidion resinicola]|uniref:Aflatoxin biosynthesis ketoreductase-like protein nor-1 n=1 Tax=Mytilinidion resinicola TaxID=574789 RepID=A0A6A6YKX4_9PEZI|nr:aflatoxin biosynthesis ketoreductase-like protein nor-1 [Mytilinidion resinicola]KAF2809471.1 aflatoxin biosynthesis ketoreductase-like protein nor-1 [Mytilinidion resinicola]
MSDLTYLITGANRGIGLGLVAHYLSLSNTTVIATARNVDSASKLTSLKHHASSRLITIQLDNLDPSSIVSAISKLGPKYGITAIDVVIANAGLGSFWGTALNTPLEEFSKHLAVNATGTLALFQAVYPLLEKSTAKEPKFIPIGTPVGGISEIENYPLGSTAYGSSKAALNFLTRKIHFEHEKLCVFPLAPGWVQTDMGQGAAESVGMEAAPTTIDESVAGLSKTIDNATRATLGGVFASYDGKVYGW